MKRISKTVDQLFEKIIQEHEQVSRSEQVQGNHRKDFVDVLLSLIHQPLNPNDEEVYMFERTNAKAILLDMISGSFDTSATTIRTLQAPESYEMSPKIAPKCDRDGSNVDGYHIPKKSRVFINIWTIGRDPNVWSDNVEEFYPERFMNSNVDLQGHDFQLIPFGSGRRGCPAMQLGLTTVSLALGNWVHCFNWELPTGMLPQDLDMTEKFGISLSKAKHLLAMPTHRL
ncbi:hypothetical protein ACFX2I_015743 [Malus domestica]